MQDDDADVLIPIETIEVAPDEETDGPFVPQALADDPDTGDGSTTRDGVAVSAWRLRTLKRDRLESVSEPPATGRGARKARRVRKASRDARNERRRARRGRARTAAALLLALAVCAVSAAGISYALEEWGGKTIPSVVGASRSLAVSQLEDKGFAVTVVTEPSDTVEGHVVSVAPAEGERVPEGSKVVLTVGAARVIPDVVGMRRDDATAALESAGATNIRYESRVILEQEDSVLEVVPAPGAVFMSSDEVTLVVAQLPLMPDVVGEQQAVALATLTRAGIPAHAEFERGGVEDRLLVVRTSPEAGEELVDDEATVYVGDPLVDVLRVCDYFDAAAPHVDDFVQGEGLVPKVAHRTQDGHVMASYAEGGLTLAFVPEPWSRAIEADKQALEGVMDGSARIEGVRLVATLSSTLPSVVASARLRTEGPAVGEETARAVMRACGLEGLVDYCTPAKISLPKDAGAARHEFYCCFGVEDTKVWTVLVREEPQGDQKTVTAVVTCVPRSKYATIDLADYGNNACDYVAYYEEYAK